MILTENEQEEVMVAILSRIGEIHKQLKIYERMGSVSNIQEDVNRLKNSLRTLDSLRSRISPNIEELVLNKLSKSYSVNIDLKIPSDKLIIEKNIYASNPNTYSPFPFFLRLENEQNIECVVINQFPNCYYHKYNKSQSPSVNNIPEKFEEVVLDANTLDFYLAKGLRWVHVNEYATLSQSDYKGAK